MSGYDVNKMDGDQKFGLAITKALAWATTAIIAVISGCNMHIDYRIAKAIESGSDPVLARAAFSNSDGSYERLVHIAKKAGAK